MIKACYPGTFDPITKGHLDIIARAAQMFDEVVVLIMINPRKQCTFSDVERKELIEQCVATLPTASKIKVMIGTGLTVSFAKSIQASVIIRGIRAVSDYEYELQQATANLMLNPEIETLFFIAKPEYSFLSSSVVKEIAINGGDITNLLPSCIVESVTEKLVESK